MGFCILGGKENYLRKVLSEKLTALGHAIGIGATPDEFADSIQDVYDDQYAAGEAAMTISGAQSSDVYSRSTTSSMSYTISINNNYKYVAVMCTDADTGAIIAHNAPTMSHTLLDLRLPYSAQSIAGQTIYPVARVMIGLASVSHSFSWAADAWGMVHNVRIIYFN